MQLCLWLLGSYIKLITPSLQQRESIKQKTKRRDSEGTERSAHGTPEGVVLPQPPCFQKGNPLLQGVSSKKEKKEGRGEQEGGGGGGEKVFAVLLIES